MFSLAVTFIIHGDDLLKYHLQHFVAQALEQPINAVAMGCFTSIHVGVLPIIMEECKHKEKEEESLPCTKQVY